MRFDLITLFPDFFASPLASGLVGKALARDIAQVHCTDPRQFATDKHHKADDEPYGGGVGMVLKPEPIVAAIESLPCLARREVIYFTPQGEAMSQDLFKSLAIECDQLVLVCGHYEGLDDRALAWVTREVSLGDFVLTCGEIPALALLNGVLRLLPGTVGKTESLKAESFEEPLLDYPHYTRPALWRDRPVPPALQSGNHGAIAAWRREEQLLRTYDRRPDLLARYYADQGLPFSARPEESRDPSIAGASAADVLDRLLAEFTAEAWPYQLTGRAAIALYGGADLVTTWPPADTADLAFDLPEAALQQVYTRHADVALAAPTWGDRAGIHAVWLDLVFGSVRVTCSQVERAELQRGQKRSPRSIDLNQAHERPQARPIGRSIRVRPLSAIVQELKLTGQTQLAQTLNQLLSEAIP